MHDDRLIREIESVCRPAYLNVRTRFQCLGLNHMAHEHLRTHFGDLNVLGIEFALIDWYAILAGAEDAGVEPDIVIQHALRKALPGAYYLRGAQQILRVLESTADVIEDLQRRGVPYDTVDQATLFSKIGERARRLTREQHVGEVSEKKFGPRNRH